MDILDAMGYQIDPDDLDVSHLETEAVPENAWDCPRYDLLQQFRISSMGAVAGVLVPVETPCVDLLDFFQNGAGVCICLEYSGFPVHGHKQLTMRLLTRIDEKFFEKGPTHAWFSDDAEVFRNVLATIRSAVAEGASPLWEIARKLSIPKVFVEALSKGIGGNVVCGDLCKRDVELAISMGVCSLETYLAALGCRPSPYVRTRKSDSADVAMGGGRP